MHENQRQTIWNLHQHFEADSNVLALIIIGSVARDDAGADSDVDFYAVVNDEEYRRRKTAHDHLYDLSHLAVAPGEGANGRAIPVQYLKNVAHHGNEPSRYSFTCAKTAFTRLPAIESLVANCAVYPEYERDDKMMSFVAQIPVHFSFLEFGHYSQTHYVLAETAVKIVLYGGRLLLAHNRMLYPGRKRFMIELDKAPDKPDNTIALANQLLIAPSIEKAKAFVDPVINHAQWLRPPEGIAARFFDDSVDQWERGWCPLEES
jgi:predicted nucleotidyltransferase